MSVLPKHSIVLVSGSNGWIASHIVDQLLQAGYNVRGTSREVAKAQWLKEYVERAYGPGRFEIAVVPDMGVEGAFDEAVNGEALPLLSSCPDESIQGFPHLSTSHLICPFLRMLTKSSAGP